MKTPNSHSSSGRILEHCGTRTQFFFWSELGHPPCSGTQRKKRSVKAAPLVDNSDISAITKSVYFPQTHGFYKPLFGGFSRGIFSGFSFYPLRVYKKRPFPVFFLKGDRGGWFFAHVDIIQSCYSNLPRSAASRSLAYCSIDMPASTARRRVFHRRRSTLFCHIPKIPIPTSPPKTKLSQSKCILSP